MLYIKLANANTPLPQVICTLFSNISCLCTNDPRSSIKLVLYVHVQTCCIHDVHATSKLCFVFCKNKIYTYKLYVIFDFTNTH